MASFTGQAATYTGWTALNNSRPSFTLTPAVGTATGATMIYYYNRAETADGSNMQATYGGVAATVRDYLAVGGNNHAVVFIWDATATAARANDTIDVTGSSTPDGYYVALCHDDTKDGAPALSIVDASAYPGTTPDQTVTLTSSADLQVVAWVHAGTDNRTFTQSGASRTTAQAAAPSRLRPSTGTISCGPTWC